jgi:glycosyltransferase involved in cell wall biosynthesis
VPQALLDAPCPARPAEGPFTVLWVGRISPEKAFGLCLEAARLTMHPDVRFIVVGDGPGAEAARGRVRQLGLDGRVTFLGRKPWEEVQALLRTAHLFLFTSIRDTSGNTALEALAAGAPVVCIDHQGVGAHLPPEAAVKLPPAGPAALARGFAEAIEALARDRERLAGMSAAARRYARSVGWDVRTAAMQAHYRMLVQRRARGVAPRTAPPAATGVALTG